MRTIRTYDDKDGEEEEEEEEDDNTVMEIASTPIDPPLSLCFFSQLSSGLVGPESLLQNRPHRLPNDSSQSICRQDLNFCT